jgi:hypothetical protein
MPGSSTQPVCLGIQAGSATGGSSATKCGKTVQVPGWQTETTQNMFKGNRTQCVLELTNFAVVGLHTKDCDI